MNSTNRIAAGVLAASLAASFIVPVSADQLTNTQGVISNIDLRNKSFEVGGVTYLVSHAFLLDQLHAGNTVDVQSTGFPGTPTRWASAVQLSTQDARVLVD